MRNKTELAKLNNSELVYGTYDEVEAYAEEKDTCVDRYFDHINPSTVYNKFKWIGKGMTDPYAVSVPYNYDKASPKSDYNTRGVDQNKW